MGRAAFESKAEDSRVWLLAKIFAAEGELNSTEVVIRALGPPHETEWFSESGAGCILELNSSECEGKIIHGTDWNRMQIEAT